MTTEFKAVTPQRAVEIMKAWAYHPWPITFDEGTLIYTSLGFKGDPKQPRYFTSDMSPTKPDSTFIVRDGHIEDCRMRLSNWLPEEKWAKSLQHSRRAYTSFVAQFSRLLGRPQSVIDTNAEYSTRWIVNNMTTVRLGGNAAFIALTIESPKQTGYLLEELAAKENGEEIGADYF